MKKYFANLSIRFRLLLGFALLGFLLVGIAALSWLALNKVQSHAEQIIEMFEPQVDRMTRAELLLVKISLEARHAILSVDDEQELSATLVRVADDRDNLINLITETEANLSTDVGRDIISNIREADKVFWQLSQQIVELAKAGQTADAYALLTREIVPARNRMLEHIADQKEWQRYLMNQTLADARDIIAQVKIVLVIAITLVLIFVSFFLTRLVHSITNPLTSLFNTIILVEQSGDYTKRVAVVGEDEVAKTAAAFDRMMVLVENRSNELAQNREHLEELVVQSTEELNLRKEAEAHIRHQAYYDALTQLPNRHLLLDRLQTAIRTAERDQQTISVLFIDLDRFKYVNDTLGHEYGDELLVQVSKRLTICVRASDTVARFGGDEFVILLNNIKSERAATLISKKIIQRLSKPFTLAGREIAIGASIGLTLFPGESDDPDTLLRNADLAMYQAKQSGRNRFQFFTKSLQEQANTLMEMEQDLRLALDKDQMEIFYQPLIEASTGKVTGVEALLRWHHPTLGMVPPDKFIPLAEDTGLIGPIGQWVLETACRQVNAWRQQGFKIYLSVNISGRQRDLGLDASSLKTILEKSHFPADELVLEITEGMLLDNRDATIDWLQSFSNMGVHLAIDDFGTGYSALSYLKRFPIDMLKIDREFISEMTVNNEDALLVEAIISMARSLKLHLVAEGVETEEQRKYLLSLGCEYLQGYFFCKPLPGKDFIDWMKTLQP